MHTVNANKQDVSTANTTKQKDKNITLDNLHLEQQNASMEDIESLLDTVKSITKSDAKFDFSITLSRSN